MRRASQPPARSGALDRSRLKAGFEPGRWCYGSREAADLSAAPHNAPGTLSDPPAGPGLRGRSGLTGAQRSTTRCARGAAFGRGSGACTQVFGRARGAKWPRALVQRQRRVRSPPLDSRGCTAATPYVTAEPAVRCRSGGETTCGPTAPIRDHGHARTRQQRHRRVRTRPVAPGAPRLRFRRQARQR